MSNFTQHFLPLLTGKSSPWSLSLEHPVHYIHLLKKISFRRENIYRAHVRVWSYSTQCHGEERRARGESFGSTHPIVLRYRVTRWSLISDRQVAGEKAGGVVEFQSAAVEDERPPREGAQFLQIRAWKTLLIIIALGSLAPLLKSNRIPVASRIQPVNDVCFSRFTSPSSLFLPSLY